MPGSATGTFTYVGAASGHAGGRAAGAVAWPGTATGQFPSPGGSATGAYTFHEISGGESAFVYELYLEVLTPTLDRAPTTVAVTVSEAAYGAVVTFAIDGVVNTTAFPDIDGSIKNLSLIVDETHAAGTHTITATQGGSVGTGTFTLADSPFAAETAQPIHSAPTVVTGRLQPSGFYRWALQDRLPGGLGNWIMPKNPDTWTEPVFERTLTAQHTTAPSGQFHITEGEETVQEFTFSGVLTTQTECDKLAAFNALNRRFYLFDHRDRAWLVTFLSFDFEPRTRKSVAGLPTDWVADYTVRAVAYKQDWEVAL